MQIYLSLKNYAEVKGISWNKAKRMLERKELVKVRGGIVNVKESIKFLSQHL